LSEKLSENKHPLLQALDPLSLHFAKFVLELAGLSLPDQSAGEPAENPADEIPLLWYGALAASRATSEQNACADLGRLATQAILPESPEAGVYPELRPWLTALAEYPELVGQPGELKPLILVEQRLYLCRYWQYEHNLAGALLARTQQSLPLALEASATALQRLFPVQASSANAPAHAPAHNWQALAAACALLSPLTIISGGPGTGKTTTISRLLALLLSQEPDLRVALAAPTGKAAARMKQALDGSLQQLALPAEIAARFPQQAMTLHRLLGYLPGRVDFYHGPEQPLPWDLVVVDEASMIDLALMTKLVQAVRPEARLILLGDKDQLASVEAGSVLGDICRSADSLAFGSLRRQQLAQITGTNLDDLPLASQPLDDHVITLQVSHRFAASSGIGQVASAVRAGQSERALQLLADPSYTDLSLQPLPSRWQTLQAELYQAYLPYLSAPTAADALQKLDSFMLLCALRRGPYGVEQLNREVEQALLAQKALHNLQTWYHLRPVLITANDYVHQLFNGDIGVVWNPQGHSPRIWFHRADGSIRDFAPTQLGAHQSAWALTVHKSQGSEFDRVWLILPPEPHPLLTRELVYTGLTRARQAVSIYGDSAVLGQGIASSVMRDSGLQARLSRLPGA